MPGSPQTRSPITAQLGKHRRQTEPSGVNPGPAVVQEAQRSGYLQLFQNVGIGHSFRTWRLNEHRYTGSCLPTEWKILWAKVESQELSESRRRETLTHSSNSFFQKRKLSHTSCGQLATQRQETKSKTQKLQGSTSQSGGITSCPSALAMSHHPCH